jgi:hypothetical protein
MPGIRFFSVLAYRFSSRAHLNTLGEHIVKVTHIISKSSLLAEGHEMYRAAGKKATAQKDQWP